MTISFFSESLKSLILEIDPKQVKFSHFLLHAKGERLKINLRLRLLLLSQDSNHEPIWNWLLRLGKICVLSRLRDFRSEMFPGMIVKSRRQKSIKMSLSRQISSLAQTSLNKQDFAEFRIFDRRLESVQWFWSEKWFFFPAKCGSVTEVGLKVLKVE